MTTRNFTVTRINPLQNQDIARFIECANSYRSSISLANSEVRVNAKSLLGVLAMELAEGQNLTISADGPDENEAIAALLARLVA